MTMVPTWTFCVAAVLVAAGVGAQQGPPSLGPKTPNFPSPWVTGGPGWDDPYAKAKAFVAQLTLVEKVNLTSGVGWESDRCVGNTGSVPRLGFAAFCLEDGPIGVRYTDANSVFPAGINAAATFSRKLIRERGEAMGREFRGKGIDVQLGPVAGPLGRVPAGGRNWEGFSPDPYLTGVAMAETVEGIQSEGVIACAKHYILNEQEHFRNNIDVRIDDRTMHELYLWPFADSVRAGVGSFMCSYNKINGDYACENGWTNNYLLKNELSFQGFVMSDWGAQKTTVESALGGLDMAMPGDGARNPYNSYWGGMLTEAVLNGTIPEWRLDDMVIRIMAAFYKVNKDGKRVEPNFSAWIPPNTTYGPLYHKAPGSPIVEIHKHVNVQGNHAELIREMAAKSAVLLKNEKNALPLGKPKSIAVIGEDAQDPLGGPNACVDNKCYRGTLTMGYGSATAYYPWIVSPINALQTRAKADGTQLINVPGNWDLDAARKGASQAEVALVFASATSGENFITIDGNAGDRNNLTLWNGGDELIRAVAAVHSNTVVVLHTVGPVVIEYAKLHPNITAILWAGLPGQESGGSLVDVLYGKVNPQGHSPFTWAKREADYGPQLLYKSNAPPPAPGTPPGSGPGPWQTFPEGVFIDYRHFQKAHIEPLWEFGFGLSYTDFRYENLSVTATPASYTPAKGMTPPAPTYGAVNKSVEANVEPAGFARIRPYIYPWINSTFKAGPVGSEVTAGRNGSAQPVVPSGGAPGGNKGLYDEVYKVEFTVKNVGKVAGADVPQLYVQLGGDENPWGVLRGFDDVFLAAGEAKRVAFSLTRRDISNWDEGKQDWVVNGHAKTVFVGYSSTQIALNATLPALKS